MDAGTPFPEGRERGLIVGARRAGPATERLHRIEIVGEDLAAERPRSLRLELGAARQDERVGERQALGAHRSERRRRRPPLTDGRAADEGRVAAAEAVVGAHGQDRVRDVGAPVDAILDARLAEGVRPGTRRTALAECLDRCGIRGVEHRRLPGREQADQRRVGGGDDRRLPRRAIGRPPRHEQGRVALIDAVVGIEHRRLDDGPQPRTRDVRRAGRDERVDEDLVPLEHRVDRVRRIG